MPIAFPCAVCNKNVLGSSIYCNNCNLWVHKKCNYLTENEFKMLTEEDDDKPFCCIKCLNSNIPFTNTTEADFYSLIKCGTIIDTKLLEKSD